MQKPSFDDKSFSSADLLEDDIDQLFGKLQPIVAPADIVQQVLANLKQKQFPLYRSSDADTDDDSLLSL